MKSEKHAFFRKMGDINTSLKIYYIFFLVMCLVFPSGTSIASHMGISGSDIPIYKWMNAIEGHEVFYRDFFLCAWLVTIFWLAFAGFFYAKSYSHGNANVSALFVAFIISTGALFLLMSSSPDITSNITSRTGMIITICSRSRIFGSLFWPGLLMISFSLAFLSFVKLPIDLYKSCK